MTAPDCTDPRPAPVERLAYTSEETAGLKHFTRHALAVGKARTVEAVPRPADPSVVED